MKNIIRNKCLNKCYLNFTDREELITEHALSWNRRKIVGMVQSLAKRYTRVSMLPPPALNTHTVHIHMLFDV